MMLDFSKFKPFKVSDILQIYNGKGITKEEIEENIGDFNAVQSGEENNGVIGKINKEYCYQKGYTLTEEPCLTVARSGSSGYVSFQPYGCVVGDSAKILIIKGIHKTINIYLFIQTLLRANRFKYAYGRKVTEDNYMRDIIYLPVSSDGQPDWQYMENIIKEKYKKLNKGIITKIKSKPNSLIIPRWKLFKVSDIFDEIVSTKGATTDDLIKGREIAYIGATKSMNGLMDMVAKEGNEEFISKGNCIVFIQIGAGGAGYATYQEKDFIGMSGKTCCGYSEHLNKYNGMFIATILCQERFRYSFGRSWTGGRLLNTEIKLPAKLNSKNEYEPDWQFMEEYIKSLPYSDVI